MLQLGPVVASVDALPEPEVALASSNEEVGPVNIRLLARILRALLQALYDVSTADNASSQSDARGHSQSECSFDSFDLVEEACPAHAIAAGPLKQTKVFMEESPLLKVFRDKLCNHSFGDITGSTEQLSSFGLRNIRVLRFDLSRCTSTLKRNSDAPRHGAGEPAVEFLLAVRNLRLGITVSWDVALARFPYLALSGTGRVTAKGISISIYGDLHHTDGLFFQPVKIDIAELEVQLSCASALSQVVLSAVLTFLQATLQSHLQRQLQELLTKQLERQAQQLSKSLWLTVRQAMPESLMKSGLSWLAASIPVEGLPI